MRGSGSPPAAAPDQARSRPGSLAAACRKRAYEEWPLAHGEAKAPPDLSVLPGRRGSPNSARRGPDRGTSGRVAQLKAFAHLLCGLRPQDGSADRKFRPPPVFVSPVHHRCPAPSPARSAKRRTSQQDTPQSRGVRLHRAAAGRSARDVAGAQLHRRSSAGWRCRSSRPVITVLADYERGKRLKERGRCPV